MAAALLRGGTVFYLKCIQRDFCRVVWRSQAALLSSKPPHPSKQQRKTHIKKARPQPAIDIPKLLEQLFSQRRVSAVKASSKPLPCPGGSTKPSTATSIKTPASSLSQTKPAVSVSAAASTLKPVINVSSENSPLSKKAPNSPPAIDSQASPKSVSHSTPESVVGLTADSSPTSKTSMQSLPCFPTASAAAAVVYKKTISCSSTTSVPPSAVPTHAAKQSSTATSIEKQINTTEGRGETTVRPAEFTVAPVLPTPVDTVQIKVETSEFKEGPLIANAAAKDSNKSPTPLSVEDTTEPAICAKSIPTFESRTAPVEPTVAVTIDTADQVVGNGLTNTGADTTSGMTFLENAMKFPSVSVANKDSMVESHIFSSGTCVGTGEENGGEGGKERAVEEVIQEGALTAEPVEDEFGVIEAITLESVTPAEVVIQTTSTLDDKAETLARDTPSGAKCMTDTQAETATEVLEKDPLSGDVQVLDSEVDVLMDGHPCYVSETISKRSASIKLAPAVHISALDPHLTTCGNLVQCKEQRGAEKSRLEGMGEEEMVSVVEAMNLESMTIAEVSAMVETLETDILKEANTALEKGASILASDERMVESTVTMSADTSGETAEVEILALESLSEATDALEAEMSLVLESLYYSGPTPTVQSTVQQKPEFPETAGKNRKALGDVREVFTEKPQSQEEVIQSVIYGGDGREEDGGVLEAMSLESVTLAEVEALLGMLESDMLTETSAQLEIEAEIFAKEVGKGTERTVREDDFASEDKDETTVLTEEALSDADCLSEALEAETEILLEELLFSVPGRVAVEREALTAHKVAMDDILRGREVREHAIGREERGDEGFVANASLSIESLSLSEVEVVVETQGGDILTETITRQETAVRIPPQETQTERDCPQEEQKVFFGAVEDDNLAIAAILTNALEVESAVIPENQPCPILGPVTMKTVPSGPASTDPAPGEQDTPPAPVSPPLCNMAPPAPKEVLGLSQEEEGAGSAPPAGRKEVDAEGEAEGGRQTSTLGIPEGIDPVQRLFMEKIREYDNKCRMFGGRVEAGPDYEKRLLEEEAKLQKLYGGGDLNSFPQFTFTEPKLDQDSE